MFFTIQDDGVVRELSSQSSIESIEVLEDPAEPDDTKALISNFNNLLGAGNPEKHSLSM
jgi:hypothetical protein